MRQGQHQHQQKRMRGRNNNNRKGPNQLNRSYESNGPDVKIRGTASHIADKYVQLARDAQSSGDPISAENYLQHAEHYYRLINANTDHHGQNGRHRPMGRMDPNGHDAGGVVAADAPQPEAESGELANGSDDEPGDEGRGGSN